MATDAEKVAKYREMAKDKSLPQDVRNVYLDKANALEKQAYEATKKYAKGGAVKKAKVKMANGGEVAAKQRLQNSPLPQDYVRQDAINQARMGGFGLPPKPTVSPKMALIQQRRAKQAQELEQRQLQQKMQQVRPAMDMTKVLPMRPSTPQPAPEENRQRETEGGYGGMFAKGGAVKSKAKPKAMAKGGAVKSKAKDKGKPALAIVIGVGKPKAMNKGGMAKKGKC